MDKLTLLFLALSMIGTSVAFECPENTNCNCTKVNAEERYTLECPTEDHIVKDSLLSIMNIEIDMISQRTVLRCNIDTRWNISHISDLHIGSIKEVNMKFCNIPPDGFHQLLAKLGITAVKALSYVGNFSASENVTLVAQSVNGLSTLETLHNMHLYPKIDEHVFASMPNLTNLKLEKTNIRLTSSMFNSLTQLKSLFLPLNKIQQLPSGIFHSLQRLEHLSLWSNKITTINRDLFRTLNKLKSLELSDNAIDEIPEDAFDDLESLETLRLMANQFQTLPANLFRQTKFLQTIKMGSNPHLSSLPDYLFTNLLHLKIVDLAGCSLTTLPPKLFDRSYYIREILINRNALQVLPEDVFDYLHDMKALNLGDNFLETLPDKIFHHLQFLQVLNLSNNSMATITSELFSTLNSLNTLDLSHNQIENISKFAFENNQILNKLLLADNKLKFATTDTASWPLFQNLVKLEVIDLSNNLISSIDIVLQFIDLVGYKLKQINFANNQLKEFPYFNFRLAYSTRRVNFDLTSNQIAVVDLSVPKFRFQGAIPHFKLTLAHNPINCNCSNYDFMCYFDGTMNSSSAKLLEIPSRDVNCLNERIPIKQFKLETLLCPLEASPCPNKCTCFYRPFNKAFIVDCSKRNLTTIPDILLPSEDMQIVEVEIDLKHNRIKQGPTESHGYENVTKLMLSNNTISDLSWLPKNFKVLHLDNNNLTSLNVEMLDKFRNSTLLTNLSLHNNPWRCDCEAERFTSLLRSNLRKYIMDVSNIRCSEDQRALIDLNRKDLCSNETTVILVISTLIILFLIAALVACYYCYQEEIKVWLYAHNMCLWFVTEEEVDKNKLYDAFLSYSHKDEEFVVNNLVPILEEGPQPYKLCLHFRNWIAGEYISTQIARSVETSRRTIVILSQSFLKSVWGKMEFRTAHAQAMSEGRARVIVVVLGDVNLEDALYDELKAYLDTNTYVKWGDPWFWDKLRYALPHSKMAKNINDELNLVGRPTTSNLGSTPPAASLNPRLLMVESQV